MSKFFLIFTIINNIGNNFPPKILVRENLVRQNDGAEKNAN